MCELHKEHIDFDDECDVCMRQEADKYYEEQKLLIFSSMRSVKKELGMLGVRAVKLVIQRLKDDVFNIDFNGFVNEVKSPFYSKAEKSENYETPLIIYEASMVVGEDNFSGVMWIKIKSGMFLKLNYNG